MNIYDFDYCDTDWKGLRFETYVKEWLDFVSKCRSGLDNSNYDMVVGGIADNKVIMTLDRYFNWEISEVETLGLLKYERPNIQYCIKSQEMLDSCLKHKESVRL